MVNEDVFKEIIGEERFSIKPNQVCVLILEFHESKIFVGHFVEFKNRTKDRDAINLTDVYRFADYLNPKRWLHVVSRQHQYQISTQSVIKFYIPKEDLDLDACMKLWS